ncbi:MAG: cupin domain-containing protein [Synergistaceae bacterium]|nr:cupin domain-containing protein [Synergistaceae bacterium]
MNANIEQIREIVKKILEEAAKEQAVPFEKHTDKSGVFVVKTATVKGEPFDTGKPGDNVKLIDLATLEESPRMGVGIMEMDHTTFDWFLNYDEYDYIIEGSLSIVIDENIITGNKGDILFIPKGSKIQFSAPKFARFMYVSCPADWANA